MTPLFLSISLLCATPAYSLPPRPGVTRFSRTSDPCFGGMVLKYKIWAPSPKNINFKELHKLSRDRCTQEETLGKKEQLLKLIHDACFFLLPLFLIRAVWGFFSSHLSFSLLTVIPYIFIFVSFFSL